jgi:hypothetical protein
MYVLHVSPPCDSPRSKKARGGAKHVPFQPNSRENYQLFIVGLPTVLREDAQTQLAHELREIVELLETDSKLPEATGRLPTFSEMEEMVDAKHEAALRELLEDRKQSERKATGRSWTFALEAALDEHLAQREATQEGSAAKRVGQGRLQRLQL